MAVKRNKIKRAHAAAISLVLQGSEKNSKFLLVQSRPGVTDQERRAVALLAQSTQAEYDEIMARWAGDRWMCPSMWPPFLALQEAIAESQSKEDVTQALDEFRQLAESLIFASGDDDGDEPSYMGDNGGNQPVAQASNMTVAIPSLRIKSMKLYDNAGNAYEVPAAAIAQSQVNPQSSPQGQAAPSPSAGPPATPATPVPQVAGDNSQPINAGVPSNVSPLEEPNPDSPEAIARQVRPLNVPPTQMPARGGGDAAFQASVQNIANDPFASVFSSQNAPQQATAGLPAATPVQTPTRVPAQSPTQFQDGDGNVWQLAQPAATVPPVSDAASSGQLVAQAAAVIQELQAENARLRATMTRVPEFYGVHNAPRQLSGEPATPRPVAQGASGDVFKSLFDPITPNNGR